MEWLTPALAILILFTQSYGQETNKITAAEEKLVEEAVTKRVLKYVAAMKIMNIDELISFWANTDKFVKAGDGSLVIGYDSIAKQQREQMSKIASVNFVRTKNHNVYVLAKDAASFSFEFEWSMTDKNGKEIISKGSWTYVFKFIDEDWKVVHSAGAHIK